MRGTWFDQPDLDDDGFTRISNVLLDMLFPLLPQNDVVLFLYAIRRQLGYREEREAGVVRIAHREFVNGRCDQHGAPIDFGSGLVHSEVQLSVDRLERARMLVRKQRGKLGRPTANPGPEDITLWEVNTRIATGGWTLAPFFERMTYGQLGRYVVAATHLKLPPPATAKEAASLLASIEAKMTAKSPAIPLPEQWQTPGLPPLPVRPVATNKPNIGSISRRKNAPTLGSLPGDNAPTLGSLPGNFPDADAEKEVRKETSLTKKRIKETLSSDALRASAEKESAPAKKETTRKGGKATAVAKAGALPSKDGMPTAAWMDQFVTHCYGGKVLPQWTRYVQAVHDLRAEYPLAVVLAYYDTRKKEAYWRERTLDPNVLVKDIRAWSGLANAERRYARQQQGAVTGGETAIVERRDSGNGGAAGTNGPATPCANGVPGRRREWTAEDYAIAAEFNDFQAKMRAMPGRWMDSTGGSQAERQPVTVGAVA